jgi:membrane-associated phospholipid phosphatase
LTGRIGLLRSRFVRENVLASNQAATPVADEAHQGRSLNRFTTILLIGYLGFIVAFMVLRHAAVTADLFVVFVSVIAVMLGRGRAFVRDWAPFLLIFLAWEAMRGIANQFGAEVQSDAVIAVERFISFGLVPSAELQRLLHTPGVVGPLEMATAAIYAAHFLLPLGIAFALWLKRRRSYYHYVIALMLMSFAAFFTAVVLPVAPPRFAYQYGEALPVVDLAALVANQTGIGMLSWAYHNLIGNPVAAFPSLHAAYPILGFFFLRDHWPRASGLMLVYAAAVWFSIVYLGHHYVLDVIGGLAYAVAAYLVVRSAVSGRLGHWWRARMGRATEPGRV